MALLVALSMEEEAPKAPLLPVIWEVPLIVMVAAPVPVLVA